MRMLIVEDEKDLCNILKKRLQKDYTIDICMDGEIAKDYLNTYTYDIILLDIMLPKIDGITLLKWLRNQKKTTPVLLLTAKSSIEERVNGLDSGMRNPYLTKKNKCYHTLFAIAPKGIRVLHKKLKHI